MTVIKMQLFPPLILFSNFKYILHKLSNCLGDNISFHIKKIWKKKWLLFSLRIIVCDEWQDAGIECSHIINTYPFSHEV